MPTYSVQAPNGQTYSIDGPAGATDQQVQAQIIAQHPEAAKPKDSQLGDILKSYGTGLKQGVAGIADGVASFIPGLNVLERMSTGGNAGSVNLTHPVGNLFTRLASGMSPDHTPQTTAGQYARTVGQFTPAAAAPGSIPARVANVFIPAIASEGAGQTAHALGASPMVERAARTAGAIVGGFGASARFGSSPAEAPTPDDTVANLFAKRSGVDPAAVAAKTADMRAAGVEPTMIDVTGTPGQRLVKAVGITNDQAGEALQNNAQTVASTTKPAVMDRTRSLSPVDQTATQLASNLAKARQEEAATTYAEPYAAPIQLQDRDVIQALRDPEGAGAINRAITAARARMDYKAVADLQQLKATAAGPTGDGQVWPTTGRALDRVQIAFGNKGNALAQNGHNDIASGMFMRQERINSLLDNVPGLADARGAYRAKSQAIDILQKPDAIKDPFSTDPADYRSWVGGLSPEAKTANQVAIRQNILDTLGGQRSSALGSLDELATSPYARQNLAAALGEDRASAYLSNIAARLSQRRNATQVSPYAGSPTKMLQNDTGGFDKALDVADTAMKLKSGNVIGLASKLSAYLKSRGLSDQQAVDFANASVDPARVDGVVAALGRLKGAREAQGFVQFRGGLVGSLRASSPQRQPAPQ